MKNKNIIFFISSGRSGSLSLKNSFNSINGFKAFHKENQLEKENCLNYHKKINNVNKLIYDKRFSIIENVCNKDINYIECSWYMCTFIHELVNNFPECKIFHLVRNGRNFVKSGMSRSWFKGKDTKYYKSINSWSRDRWNPPKECKNRFEKICWLWNEQQKIIYISMKNIPDINNYGIIKFEDLVREGSINFILDKLNMKIKRLIKYKKSNHTKKQTKINYNSIQYKKSADKWMGEMMRTLYYDY